MKKRLYTLAFSVLIGLKLSAQSLGGAADSHFSMFNAAPLQLNPAMTGAFDCNWRANAIFRSQWGSVLRDESVPMFMTVGGSADIRTNRGFTESGAFGFGLTAMSDRAGQSKFTTNRFGLSLAYHQALDRRNEHFIGLGFQSEIWQRAINYTGLQFPLQNDNGTYNSSFPTGEYLVNNNFLFWDLSAGLLYTGKFGYRTNGYIGFAAQHLNRPVESLLGDKNVRLPMRMTAHAGVRFKLKGRFDMQPKIVYVNQGVSHEVNLGSDFRFIFDEQEPQGNNFRFGAMFRMVGGDNKAAWKDRIVNGEAVIISLGIEYSKVNLNIAYDINVSQLANASRTYGAFEIGLSYVGCFRKSRPQTIFCPKF